MPGFVFNVPTLPKSGGVVSDEITTAKVDGTLTQPADSRREYYYKYTWEISNYFELDGAGGETLWRNNPLVYLRDATLPTFTAQSDSIIGTSLEYKWAKSIIWDDIKVSWYDSVGLVNKMKEWRRLVWDIRYGLQPGSHYKRQSELRTYLPTWDPDTGVKWRLHNSWPKVIKHGELTYTQSEVKIVEVTISYDWADENADRTVAQ